MGDPYKKNLKKNIRDNSADTLQLELVLMILKNFMNQPTLQSVKILQLKRKLLLFLKVKNQRDIINKDFLMLKERIRLDKNLLLLQKRKANKLILLDLF